MFDKRGVQALARGIELGGQRGGAGFLRVEFAARDDALRVQRAQPVALRGGFIELRVLRVGLGLQLRCLLGIRDVNHVVLLFRASRSTAVNDSARLVISVRGSRFNFIARILC